jgi:hypothetical protein
MAHPGTYSSILSPAVAISLALTLGLAAPVVAATTITTCGQEVAGSSTLTADLDCTDVEDYAVVIHHGTLTLHGFTITGGWGVFCDGPCKVVGPGTITGSEQFGINGFGSSLKVKDVTLTNNALDAIQSYRNCKIEGPAPIMNNGGGIRAAGNLTARNLTIADNAYEAINASNNAGISHVTLRAVTMTGNGFGILTQNGAKIVDSVITGNGQSGIQDNFINCDHPSSLIVLKNSTVTGNDTDPDCGITKICYDLGTCGGSTPPRLLKGSTCDHSYAVDSGNPGSDLNVCTLD